jgi:hypothetical protein
VIGVLMRDKHCFDIAAFETKLLDASYDEFSRLVSIVQGIDQDQTIPGIDGPC